LVLLRHGRTQFNAEGRLQGQLDPPLDGVGRAEALSVAAAVRALTPAGVVSSDLARARTTAELIGLPFTTDERLREINLGTWQGLTLAAARERYPAEWASWREGGDGARGGGESYLDLAKRGVAAMLDALDQLGPAVSAEHPLLVVTHGGTARCIVSSLLELPEDLWWRVAGLRNCAWSRLEESRRGWRLLEYGGLPAFAGPADG
jgi:probable phosphoglycerate mutase